jgi:hypothetical protein
MLTLPNGFAQGHPLNRTSPSNSLQLLENSAPSISILEPLSNQQLASPTNLHIVVDARDADGSVSSVDLYYKPFNGPQVFLGQIVPPGTSLDVTNFSGIDGTLSAIATDNLGATSSTSVQLSLLGVEGDDFRRPYVLSGTNAISFANNSKSTRQPLEPVRLQFGLFKSVWWKWTAPISGLVTVSTEGSSFDTVLEVTDGEGFPNRIAFVYNDDSSSAPSSLVKFDAAEGDSFYFMVAGATTNDYGDIMLRVNEREIGNSTNKPPANDIFAQAELIEGSEVSLATSNAGATLEPGEPLAIGKTLWWKWRSPENGRVLITTEGSDFDTYLSVFADSDLVSELTPILRNDDAIGITSDITINCTSNTVYLISVGGYYDDEGRIKLSLKFTPGIEVPPANDNFEDRTKVTGDFLFLRARNTFATVEPGEPELNPSSINQSIWWEWTAPKNGWVTITSRFIGRSPTPPFSPFIDIPVGIFRGTNVDALELVARGMYVRNYSDQKSTAQFFATAGEKYQILSSAFGLVSDREQLIINQLTPASGLLLENPAVGPDEFSFDANRDIDKLYIESSTNLVDWRSIGVYDLTNSANHISIPRRTNAAEFFRAYSVQ